MMTLLLLPLVMIMIMIMIYDDVWMCKLSHGTNN